MKKLITLFSLSLTIILFGCPVQSSTNLSLTNDGSVDSYDKVIMAIFAHPDDESTVAPILSKYVREGVKVYLVVTTDGRLGTNDFTDHEAGDGLAAMRREEMKCAAEKLGVELIHLDYYDQLKAEEGYDGHIPHVRALIKEIHQIISDKKPDVLITWGPDGGSNHMDHRLIGASVTSVFLSQDWEKPSSLFYYGRPSNLMENQESKILSGVDPKYMTTKVSFTEEDLNASIESLSCHKSQIQIDKVRDRFKNRYQKGMYVYLRKFEGPHGQSSSVFE